MHYYTLQNVTITINSLHKLRNKQSNTGIMTDNQSYFRRANELIGYSAYVCNASAKNTKTEMRSSAKYNFKRALIMLKIDIIGPNMASHLPPLRQYRAVHPTYQCECTQKSTNRQSNSW